MKKVILAFCVLLSWNINAQTPQLVNDHIPGIIGGNPLLFTIFQDKLYYTLWDETYGRELFVYDGFTKAEYLISLNNISCVNLWI